MSSWRAQRGEGHVVGGELGAHCLGGGKQGGVHPADSGSCEVVDANEVV